MTTSVSFKIHIDRYKYLQELAEKQADGNLSAFIKKHLPKLPEKRELFKEIKRGTKIPQNFGSRNAQLSECVAEKEVRLNEK